MRWNKNSQPSIRTVFARFIINYLILLIILTGIGGYVYNKSLQFAKEKAIESGISKLDKSKDLLTTRLQEVESLVNQLSMNTLIQSFMNVKKPYNGEDYYKIKEIADHLSTSKFNNRFVKETFLYLKNDTLITSSMSTANASLVYGKLLKQGDLDYLTWQKNLLGKYQYATFWPEANLSLNNDSRSVITYVQSVPIGAVNTYKGAIAVLIDSNEVHKLLSTVIPDESGWSYVADRNGTIISELNHSNEPSIGLQIPEEARGYAERTINGTKMIMMYTTSDSSGWIYVAAVPYDFVVQSVEYIKRMYIYTIIVTIVVGVLIAIAFSYTSSKPIHNLIRSRDQLRKDLNEQFDLVKATFLERLLRGGFTKEKEIETVRSYIGLDLVGNQYIAVMISIEGYGTEDISPGLLERLDLAKVVIHNTFKDMIAYPTKYFNIDNEKIVFIIAYDEKEGEGIRRDIEKTVETVTNLLTQSHGINIRVGVGNPCSNLINIRNSFDEAMQVLDSLIGKSSAGLAFYKEIQLGQIEYYFPLDVETRLMNLVKAGDETEVKSLLEELYGRNTVNISLQSGMLTQLSYELRGTAVKLKKALAAHEKEESNQVDTLLEEIVKQQTLPSLFESAGQLFLLLCSIVNRQQGKQKKALKDKMMSYVSQHFKEDDLSLYRISSDLGMTEKYFSHVFKELIGDSFTQFLEKTRMDCAVGLLKDDKVSVNDIARLSGYANPNTFYKAFKRYFGVSPTTYRQQL
ncbi:helix-turn-helix domain-containing protein [Cohnella silvisoli]|uniref:Helix-turn-helix domain-containing protein n=1 Tax=Cohnella silvisoli TaxID=2873699 RepID=A0ABV1KW81_9BACL|nr:helix-turn-helix domain-containing protein [Cohnella silvisoli]MCD9023769.1 helix-turn-helix domain-containing protein [Cohnella silvisoli]